MLRPKYPRDRIAVALPDRITSEHVRHVYLAVRNSELQLAQSLSPDSRVAGWLHILVFLIFRFKKSLRSADFQLEIGTA
jgi:hypothetical protein